MRMMQRFPIPGVSEEQDREEEPAEADTFDLEKLQERKPVEQVAAFKEMREDLPAQVRDLVDDAAEIAQHPPELSAMARQLKVVAQAQLAGVPRGEMEDLMAVVDKLCAAVADAWTQWKLQAAMTNVVINAVTAAEGEIVGPPVGPLVLNLTRASSDAEAQAAGALAGTLGEAFTRWQKSVKIPGLPLYPTFGAFPAPVAPPTPNVPIPLVAFTSEITAFTGLDRRVAAQNPTAATAARAVALAFAAVFPLWLAQTMVVGLLGHGPVPSFAPPNVPVGPVVGGKVLPVPGCFV
jgi:hypothetical protein